MVGGIISKQSYRHQWRLEEQTQACTALLREASVVYMALSGASRADLPSNFGGKPLLDFRPWNQALNLLNRPDCARSKIRQRFPLPVAPR
ncbi:hypothetical protein [Micromonospora sp. BL4]|uniref:hypothetical protein n=1 Tax=Micromonospora sp. BL4 TaxID=2478710 RepID=UPI0011C3AB39|nr:hypothetical protein [Micromonospora sp. BL4]